MHYRAILKLLLALCICCPKMVKSEAYFVQKQSYEKWVRNLLLNFGIYMQSGDGVKKPILQFKEDQRDRYEHYRIRYNRQISIYFCQLVKFLTIYFYSTVFSVDLWST